MEISFEALIARLEDVQAYEKYSVALCVFHSDSKPSMMVFKDGWFQCLGCGRRGRWKTLWDKIHGRTILVVPEKKISHSAPSIVGSVEETCYQAHADLLQFPSFQWYLEMRGIEDRIETCEIGYYQGWYTFPVRSESGEFQTAVFRAAPHVQAATGLRYWTYASKPLPYVPDWFLVTRARAIFVTFGIFDALTLSKLRFPAVTSTFGNNTVDPSWFDEFRVPINIVPDQNETSAAIALANRLGWRGRVVELSYPVGKKDPNGFLEAGRQDDLVSQLSRYIK